jgi:DNA mismatch repair protein MutS
MMQLVNTTPMLQQYLSLKAGYQDCMLFYRLGDFYELFFEDAIVAAEVLEITLTKRGQYQDEDIPMCGVPAHASDSYIEKLVKAGYKVAICEQLETPQEAKKRSSKAVVRREVVRIITAGTIMEDPMLNAKNHNFLMAIAGNDTDLSIAWVDITTGEFYFSEMASSQFAAELARLKPSEIILSESILRNLEIKSAMQDHNSSMTVRSDSLFSVSRSEKIIQAFYNISSLEVLSSKNGNSIASLGVLLDYLNHTHKKCLPRLGLPRLLSTANFMVIDAATRKNLELDHANNGSKRNSLRWVIDKTSTSCGGRLLSSHLSSPLTDPEAINHRLDSVEYLYLRDNIRIELVNIMKGFPDIERSLARIFIRNLSPKDLGSIRLGLKIISFVAELLKSMEGIDNNLLKSYVLQLGEFTGLIELLETTLVDDPPASLKENDFIRSGCNKQLDDMRNLRDHADLSLSAMQSKYRKLTGVSSLKITKNNIIGYFIEVPVAQIAKLNESDFIHRQTLGTCARFTTEELKALEIEINSCHQQIKVLEQSIFEELCISVCQNAESISLAAQAIASIDVISMFAQIAKERGYVRPHVISGIDFIITDGKHPVILQHLEDKFIGNDCGLSESETTWLITGPNMAGKSTFMRQNALICIMAQMGCFVPAKYAKIGVVDRLFSRIGAGDDISSGRSTFMVEMSETAAILNNATKNSLIILDEIGRGTSTFDGLSIAWAVTEYIHNVLKCRTLFATHYHELVGLEQTLSGLKCQTMQVREWQNSIIFMHKVVPGKADRSYGIHVAELAGVPHIVSNKAKSILAQLESKQSIYVENPVSNVPVSHLNPQIQEVISIIKDCDLDVLSPRAAYDLLYQLQTKLNNV